MANGYFERGEVYWIRMDNGFGGEQGVGRPGVILTENGVNNKCSTVTIAFMSKQHHPSNPFYLPVDATGVTSYVILNQVMTYDKSRVGKYLGVLNSAEQKLVDDALEDLFDLGYVDDTLAKQHESDIADRDALIGDLRNEVAGIKVEFEKKNEEIASLKMEIEMWQKCYGRCMDMLVETKVTGDMKRRMDAPVKVVDPEEPVIAPKKLPDPPKMPDSPEEHETDDRLDINSCTATALKKIGFSLAIARKIVESRPFDSVEDLKRINGLKATHYRIMEPKLCCVPVKVEEPEQKIEESEPVVVAEEPKVSEKVNVNTATVEELVAVGINRTTAQRIRGHRNKNGLFGSLEDLLNVDRCGPRWLAKNGDKLEV